jgi:hypothetical protein
MVEPEAAVAPEISDSATVQAKVVPVILLLSAMDEAVPEHIVCDAGVVVATGIGLTVITTILVAPAHPLADGVMV